MDARIGRTSGTNLFALLLIAGPLAACEAELQGLLPTPEGADGPTVVFDLLARPLPEIPFPNDMATRFDPDSPTGRRVNASLAAPTILEVEVRDEFNRLDGWGTHAPITVSFVSPIDPVAVREAHLNDDPSDDVVFLVDLTTGAASSLDLGRGNYPVIVQNNDKYFQNDPRADSSNMLFETYREVDTNGNGKLDPDEDTDHDDTWDVPDTLDPTKPQAALGPPYDRAAPADRGNDAYRDLMAFYERESNTLIIRPVRPMRSRTQYAVVLTDRIKGVDGKSIRSPFPFVNHVAQTDQLAPLLKHIDAGRVPGLTREHVAFAWAFTTQSTTQDLEAAREGLYGRGPLGKALGGVSAQLEPVWRVAGNDLAKQPVHPLISDSLAKEINPEKPNPFIAPMKYFRDPLEQVGPLLGAEGPTLDYLLEGYKFVDYWVVGSYRTANLLDDPTKPTAQAVWRVDPTSGQALLWSAVPGDPAASKAAMDEAEKEYVSLAFEKGPGHADTLAARKKMKAASRDRVWFMLAVPKPQYLKDGKPTLDPAGATPLFTAPFATNIYGHGYTGNRTEFLGFAGHLAKFGIASVCIDSYGHGLQLGAGDMTLVKAALGPDFAPFGDAVLEGRARDLDNDIEENSGGDFWTADTFHTRDVVRQSVLDWMQLIRVFHTFGTYDMGDLNGDGQAELAGDFNADGTVDVAGPVKNPDGTHNPGSDFFAWGQSLGGMLAGVLPTVEPTVKAAAPVAGGAGLGDIGIRSEQGGVIQAVFLQILGPIFWSEPDGDGVQLNVTVQSVNDEKRVRLTGPALAIAPGDRVEMHNLNTDNGEHKMDWAIVGADRRFRLQVAADGPSFLDGAPLSDEAVDYAACHFAELDPKTRVARLAELNMRYGADCLELRVFSKKADGSGWETTPRFVHNTFTTDVVFQQRKFAKDSSLVALARGFGFKRGNKTFRRFMSIAQTILDPADIANYAPHYFTSAEAGTESLSLRGDDGVAMMVVGTTGDLNVPVNTAMAQARAAGILRHSFDATKDADFGMSPNDVLIKSHSVEAIEKLRYFAPLADPAFDNDPYYADLRSLIDCPSPWACKADSLADVMHYSKAADGTFLDGGNSDIANPCPGAAGEERDACLAAPRGVPRLKHALRDLVVREHSGYDARGNPATRKSVLVMPLLDRQGRHGFDIADPANAFDVDLFMINLIGRYFQSRGTDLRYDLCMHRDGYTKSRLITADNPRVPACDFIPEYPATW